MTNKQVNYQVNFNPNITALKGALGSLQKDLAAITSKPITFDGGQLKAAVNDAKQLSAALQQATDVNTGKLNLSKFSQQLQQSGKTLQQYGASLQQLGPQGQQAFLKLTKSISQAEVSLRKTNVLISKLWISLKNVASWQISSSMLNVLTSGISNAVNYAKDLNESLNNIRIVSGKSAQEMEVFAEKANKAAKALSTTTTAYTDAALIYYQQGLSAKEVEERTKATIKMANVTGESADAVSSYMTAVWNNFDDGTKSLEYYADAMAKLGAATASSTDEIATGLEKFAGIAETVGLSYEYATSALATLTAETRQSAETVGTALKTIFSRLQGLSLGETLEDGTTLNKYSEALATVGVQIKEQDGSLKSMDKILDDLGKKWNFLAQDQKMALAQTVGGVRQYTQLITLMDNYKDFKINVDLAANAEGTLSEQNKIFEESWEASSKRVKASLEDIWDDIVDDDFFIELNNGLSGLIDSVGALLKGFGGIKNIIGIITPIIIGKLLPSIMNTGVGISNIFKNAVGKNSAYSPLAMNQSSQQSINNKLATGNLGTGEQRQYEIQSQLLKLKEWELKYQGSITKAGQEYINTKKQTLELESQILEKLMAQQKVLQDQASSTVRRSTRGVGEEDKRNAIKSEYKNLENNLYKQNQLKNLGLIDISNNRNEYTQSSQDIIKDGQSNAKNFVNQRLDKINQAMNFAGMADIYNAKAQKETNDMAIQQKQTRLNTINTRLSEISTLNENGVRALKNPANANEFKQLNAEGEQLSSEIIELRQTNDLLKDNIQKFDALDEDTKQTYTEFFNRLKNFIDKMQFGQDINENDIDELKDVENDARRLSENKLENDWIDTNKRLTEDLGVDSQNVQDFTEATEKKFDNEQAIKEANEIGKKREEQANKIHKIEINNENQRHSTALKNTATEGKAEQNMIQKNAKMEQKAAKETKNKKKNKKDTKSQNDVVEEEQPIKKSVEADTTPAQEQVDGFEAKEEGDPVKKPVEADTTTAQGQVDGFEAKEEGDPIKKPFSLPGIDQAQQKIMALTQTIQTYATAITGVSMAISALQSLGSIWSDDDLSLGEKITASIGSFAAMISSAAMILPLFTLAKDKDAAASLRQAGAEATNMKIREVSNKSIFKSIASLFAWGKAKDAEGKKDEVRQKKNIATGLSEEVKKGFPGMLPGIAAILAVVALGGIGLAGSISTAGAQKQQETNTKTIDKYNENHEKTTQILETQKSFNELYRKFEETGEGAQELAEEARNTAKQLGISGAEAKILAGNFTELNSAITNATIRTLQDDQNQNQNAQAAAQSNLLAIARKGDGRLINGKYDVSIGSGLFGLGGFENNADKKVRERFKNTQENYKFLKSDSNDLEIEAIGVDPNNLVALYDEITAFINNISDIEGYAKSRYYEYYSNWLNKEGLSEAVETLRGLQDTEKGQQLQLDLLTTKQDGKEIKNYEDYLLFYDSMIEKQKVAKYSTEDLNAALMADLDTSQYESARQGIEDLTKETGLAKEIWEDLYKKYGNAVFTAKIEGWMDEEQLEKEVKRAQDILNSKEITVQLNAVYSAADSFIKARQSGNKEELEKWFAENNITTDAEKIKLLNMTDEEFENYWIKGSELDFQKNAAGKTVGTEEVYKDLNNLETDYNEQQSKYDNFEKRDKDIQFLDQVMAIVAEAKSGSEGKTYEDQFLDDALKKAIETHVGPEYIEQIKKDMGYENFGEEEFQEYVTKLLNIYFNENNSSPFSEDALASDYFDQFDLFLASSSAQEKKTKYAQEFSDQGKITKEAYQKYVTELENANVYNPEDLYGMMAIANRSTTISELLQNFGSVGRDTTIFWEKLNELVGDSKNTIVVVQEYQKKYQEVLEDTSLSEEERAKRLKELERQYDSILVTEEKIAEIREETGDILSALEADERGEKELTSSERKTLYAQLAKAVNDAYDTSYTGQDIEINPELLKAIKNIIWGVDSVKEYTQSLLQIWSNPDVLNVKLDLQDQKKAEKLAVLMDKIDDVNNEVKLKEVFIEMAKLLEKDFSKLFELLATLMGIEISDETLTALGKFGSLMSDGKINLDTELNGTDEEGSSILSSADKEGYLGWLKEQRLITDDSVSYDKENDEIKIEGSNADGSITAVLEDPSNYLGYLLGDATLGKIMSFLVGEGSISDNEAITKDNIAEKAKLPEDLTQYDELADKLKEAKNLYPELTKAYNKYIEALRKGTATEDDYLEFMKAITDAEQINDYKENIKKAGEAYKIITDTASSARQVADAYEDISDILDDIFNTDIFDGEFVKNNFSLVMDFLENGTKTPSFNKFRENYYNKLKEEFQTLNLQDTTWISSEGMAVDIPIDFEVNTQKLEEVFGSLQNFADQAQAAFDGLTGPEPSTDGLTKLIEGLVAAGIEAGKAGSLIAAFAASAPGTITTDYIINIIQRFSQDGTWISGFVDAATGLKSKTFRSKEDAKSFLKKPKTQGGYGLEDSDAEAILNTYGNTVISRPTRPKSFQDLMNSNGDFKISAEGILKAHNYAYGSSAITPPTGTKPVTIEFNGSDFNTAAEETSPTDNGGGGGGGGDAKDTTPEKKVKKFTALMEQLKEVLGQLEAEYSRLEKKSSEYLTTDEGRLAHLIGLNTNLEEQLKTQGEILSTSKEELSKAQQEMLKWVKESDLTYDAEGRITNKALIEQSFDHSIADALTSDEQSALEEQKSLAIEAIENYNEIIQMMRDAEDGILDATIQINTNNLELITLPYEIIQKARERERQHINEYLGWLDGVENQSLTRIVENADKMSSLTDQYLANETKIGILLASGLTTQAQRDALEEAINERYALRGEMLEAQKTIIEETGVILEEWSEKLDRNLDKFDRINSLLDMYSSIMEVIGKTTEEHQEMTLNVMDAQVKNSKVQLSAAKEMMDAYEQSYYYYKAEYNKAVANNDAIAIQSWKEQMEAAEDKLNEATDTFRDKWQSTLDLILKRYELAVEQTITSLEDSLSPVKTLEEKNEMYEKLFEQSDRFLTNEERIYELNKMSRQINQQISKDANILTQQKLLGVQKIINELQEDNAKLTDYQLSKLQKIYDLRLAEIALEEAQNNKTQARLVRNSQGNWNYIFTANQNQLDQAAQQLEDAKYAYYSNAKEQTNNISKEILENEKALTEALSNVKRADYKTEAEYKTALDKITKYYLDKDKYLRASLKEALNDVGMNYKDSVLGQLEGYKTLEDGHTNLVTSTQKAVEEMVKHFTNFEKEVDDTMAQAGSSYKGFTSELSTSLENIDNWSETARTKISEECGLMVEALDKVITKIKELSKSGILSDNNSETNNKIKTESDKIDESLKEGIYHKGTDYTAAAIKLYETYGDTVKDVIQKVVNPLRNQKILSGKYKDEVGTAIEFSGEEFWKQVISQSSVAGTKKFNGKLTDLLDSSDSATNKAMENILEEIAFIASTSLDTDKLSGFDTGGYTGDWNSSEGRLAMLHEKEIVLNKADTKNLLSAVEVLHGMSSSIAGKILGNAGAQMTGLSRAITTAAISSMPTLLQQEVHIDASFPGVTSAQEIENALNNIINDVAQYAEIKNL